MQRPTAVGDSNDNNKRKRMGTPIDFHTIKVPKDETLIDDERFFNLQELYVRDNRINSSEDYCSFNEDNELMDLFLNLPPMAEMQNPINMQNISNHQQQDAELLLQHQQNPILYPMHFINGINVLTMRSDPAQPTMWKIYLPTSLVRQVIHWYHITLGHVGL